MSSPLSAQWFEDNYNNRKLVPTWNDYFQNYARMSDQVRKSSVNMLDVRYGDGPKEELDVFPVGGGEGEKKPVIIFIHGGWWRAMDKSDFSFVAPAFTSEGSCVVVPNYELCPNCSIPDICNQMVKAVAWVYNNIHTYGGDNTRISVLGHSAGGHAAAMMAAHDWTGNDLPATLISKAFSISGLFELEIISKIPFLKEDLKITEKDIQAASPAWMNPPKHTQFYTVVGSLESQEFLRHNKLIEEKWGKQRVRVCMEFPEENHFSIVQRVAEKGSTLHSLICKSLLQ